MNTYEELHTTTEETKRQYKISKEGVVISDEKGEGSRTVFGNLIKEFDNAQNDEEMQEPEWIIRKWMT